MSENPDRYDEGQYVSYREFKAYTDKQAEKEITIAKELAAYREMSAGKMGSLKTGQYVQIAMIALTIVALLSDIAYRTMHP